MGIPIYVFIFVGLWLFSATCGVLILRSQAKKRKAAQQQQKSSTPGEGPTPSTH